MKQLGKFIAIVGTIVSILFPPTLAKEYLFIFGKDVLSIIDSSALLIQLFFIYIISIGLAIWGSIQEKNGKVTEAQKQKAKWLLSAASNKAAQNDLQGAINDLMEAVKLNPQYGVAYYNLACYYGLLKMIEPAFKYLSMAVENGYLEFQKIEADQDLAILRSHPDYSSFVTNGYRFNSDSFVDQAKTIQSKNNQDIIDKIERLASLRDNGVLTEQEFQDQKNKLLASEG